MGALHNSLGNPDGDALDIAKDVIDKIAAAGSVDDVFAANESVALDDLGAGVQATYTLTVTVTTAQPGTLPLYINGNRLNVGVHSTTPPP